MAGLVGYGGDPRVVASRAEIERVSSHLHAVAGELIAGTIHFLPNPIHRAQVNAALPLIEYRIQKTRIALAASAESYFGAETRIAHSLESLGHALRDHPWLLQLIPKPVLENLRAFGPAAFAVAQFAPGDFGSQSTRFLASTTDLGAKADSVQRLGLLNDRAVAVTQLPAADRPPTRTLADIGARIDEVNELQSQLRIDTYESAGGQRTLVVYIPGTQSLSPVAGKNPFDLVSDTELATDPKNSKLLDAIAVALEQAGARGAHVILTGYSLGGIAAAQLAARGGFEVSGVVTIGSPVGQVDLPAEVPVLSIQHNNDPVPAATGESNPLTANWATVSRECHLPAGSVSLEAHELDRYRETLRLVDRSQLTGVSRVREMILGQLAGARLVKAEAFRLSR